MQRNKAITKHNRTTRKALRLANKLNLPYQEHKEVLTWLASKGIKPLPPLKQPPVDYIPPLPTSIRYSNTYI